MGSLSHEAEHGRRIDEREPERRPKLRTDKPEPGEVDEGGAQKRDEKAVAAGRGNSQDADPLRLRAPDGKPVMKRSSEAMTAKKIPVCQVQAIQARSGIGLS